MHVDIEERCEGAYFTVEASFVLPMVMLFTVMMIFLAFYSYDRCVLGHSAYEAAMRGTYGHIGSVASAQEAAAAAAGRLVDGRLFAIRDLTFDVLADADSVTVTYHCIVDMPFLTWLGGYVSGIDMAMDISRTAARLDPTRTIRGWQLIDKGIRYGTGGGA